MNELLAVLGILIGYFIGAIPTGLIAGRITAGIDLREHGSRNIGFTNALRVLGWKVGVPVLLVDVGKAALAVLAIPAIIPAAGLPVYPVIVGIAVLAGNIFNVFLGFRGGKGVATALGVFLALAWLPTLVALAIFLTVLAATRYVSLGSICAALALPVGIAVQGGLGVLFWATALVAVLVIVRHRENIGRLLAGTERRIGQREAARKDTSTP
jgi:glycerol-3-phosphate acyltransferase PlsY